MKRIFLCNWFFIAKCIGDYVLDFVLVNVLVNKVSIASSKTSDAKQQQETKKMIKSLVIQHVKWTEIIKIMQLLE